MYSRNLRRNPHLRLLPKLPPPSPQRRQPHRPNRKRLLRHKSHRRRTLSLSHLLGSMGPSFILVRLKLRPHRLPSRVLRNNSYKPLLRTPQQPHNPAVSLNRLYISLGRSRKPQGVYKAKGIFLLLCERDHLLTCFRPKPLSSYNKIDYSKLAGRASVNTDGLISVVPVTKMKDCKTTYSSGRIVAMSVDWIAYGMTRGE